MKKTNQAFPIGLLFILLSAIVVSCTSIPELKIHYKLPPPLYQLEGKKVALAIEDARGTKEFLGREARKQFQIFSENFSFRVSFHEEPGVNIGIYQVSAMMREGFRRRLENEGLKPLFKVSPVEPRLLIVLKEFSLDLSGRNWVAKMSYEAKLIKNGKVLSNQRVSGEAERFGLAVRATAETVTGEVFTDTVNRLDVLGLFKRAQLAVP